MLSAKFRDEWQDHVDRAHRFAAQIANVHATDASEEIEEQLGGDEHYMLYKTVFLETYIKTYKGRLDKVISDLLPRGREL